MSLGYDKLISCYEFYKGITGILPKVGIVLGSGLGGFTSSMKVECDIPYGDIPGFPVSTVSGHDGRFLLGKVGDIPTVVMKGRVHYYEGYSMEEVVLPIRLMKLMGIEFLILTNASGAINQQFCVGDFMIIRDQISNFVPSPLIGKNIVQLGERFPDMTHIYDRELIRLVRQTAEEEDMMLREGVYVQASGPNFESPAEIRMFGIMGADVVGMSTACEAIAARHTGIKTCGISCVSNMASAIGAEELSHLDVQSVLDRRSGEFERLITKTVEKMGRLES